MSIVNVSKKRSVDALPNPNNPTECSEWLQTRYMKSARDEDFQDALSEIWETDDQGHLRANPLRVGLTQETRGVMVLGPSGSGKTSMVMRNLQTLGGVTVTPNFKDVPGDVLHHLVSPEATLKGVAIEIAEAAGYPEIRGNIKASQAWDLALHRLSLVGIRTLWIDEPHHLLAPGPGRDTKMVLRRLKGLMQGPNAIALILTGVPDLEEFILQDNETYNRLDCLRLGPVSGRNEITKLGRYLNLCCEKVGVETLDDDSLLERLLMANNNVLGRSIELSLRAIRRAGRRPDRKLELSDFHRSYNLRSSQADVGPFDDCEWSKLRSELEKKGWVA